MYQHGLVRKSAGMKRQDGKEGCQADHGTDLQRDVCAGGEVNDIVEKLLAFIPQVDALAAHVGHGMCHVYEVLEVLDRHRLIDRIVLGQFGSDGEHIQTELRHPARAVALLQRAPSGNGWSRSNTPMLSMPRKPPPKMSRPSASLRLIHQL